MSQYKRHREAQEDLRKLFSHPENALVIHYSCESFADKPDGRSARVTSIAVRNLRSAATESFSIHQTAERAHVPRSEIEQRYNELERTMLADFYGFVSRHQGYTWVHWNMRDISYGFPALAHRMRVLDGAPVDIPHERLFDASRVLVKKYGVGYMKHPRLENLFKANDITMLSFLSGKDEAAAFEAGEFLKLHQSTLRKVDNIANVLERAADDTLKTNSRWIERVGLRPKDIVEALRRHWVVVLLLGLLSIGGAVAGLLGVSLKDCRKSTPVPNVEAPAGTGAVKPGEAPANPIGIGAPDDLRGPLPHHPACGSAPGGSGS